MMMVVVVLIRTCAEKLRLERRMKQEADARVMPGKDEHRKGR
jgi:hypothetical protein